MDSTKLASSRSYFLSDDSYQKYTRSEYKLGKIDKITNNECIFSVSSFDANKIISESKGNIEYIEKALGVTIGKWGNGPIHRVDINDPSKYNLHKASGYEIGVNCFWNTKLSEEEQNLVFFQKQGSDYLNVNGKSYRITYDGNNPATITIDNISYEIIDENKTPKSILKKLNGKYVTNKGLLHAPNPTGYTGETIGGLIEMVTDRVINTGNEVIHITYFGGHRPGDIEKRDFEASYNYSALSNSINYYGDLISNLDTTEEGLSLFKKYQDDMWKNIRHDQNWISNASPEEKEKQGYKSI